MLQILETRDLPLRDIPLETTDIGGKALGLFQLRETDVDVPDFAVAPLHTILGQTKGQLDPTVEKFLSGRARDSRFAIRSSMCIEDTDLGACAGLGKTALNVSGCDDIARALSAVASSFGSSEVTAYVEHLRSRFACDEVTSRAGSVIIQDMIDPVFSGVMFTCNPLTGDRSQIKIDATCGACRNVVDGMATVHACFDRLSGDVVKKGPDAPALSRDRQMALCKLADHLDQQIGPRVDVEFGFVAGPAMEERLMVLQARPITALRAQ